MKCGQYHQTQMASCQFQFLNLATQDITAGLQQKSDSNRLLLKFAQTSLKTVQLLILKAIKHKLQIQTKVSYAF